MLLTVLSPTMIHPPSSASGVSFASAVPVAQDTSRPSADWETYKLNQQPTVKCVTALINVFRLTLLYNLYMSVNAYSQTTDRPVILIGNDCWGIMVDTESWSLIPRMLIYLLTNGRSSS
eukprot:GHVQ01033009.1.p2 GENE.GHVQ01033009.1~~GHVQ01033009.1.p2  ORF type:complete len:119 (+),score=2.07 GHVQ01033009.1:775-1131(+)